MKEYATVKIPNTVNSHFKKFQISIILKRQI